MPVIPFLDLNTGTCPPPGVKQSGVQGLSHFWLPADSLDLTSDATMCSSGMASIWEGNAPSSGGSGGQGAGSDSGRMLVGLFCGIAV